MPPAGLIASLTPGFALFLFLSVFALALFSFLMLIYLCGCTEPYLRRVNS